ncbi:hypothetical protein [Nostoc sp.]|uniref:hypothetical protein n=1 Tax=Nostoc sp. TaxID=1180 RepID=UPI002FFBDEDA
MLGYSIAAPNLQNYGSQGRQGLAYNCKAIIKDVSIAEPSAAISLQPGESRIPVQLQITDSSFAGDRTFTLVLNPDIAIRFDF